MTRRPLLLPRESAKVVVLPMTAPTPSLDPNWLAQYRELRALARTLLVDERRGSSLAATDLAHEAWLRLVGGESPRDLPIDEFRRRAAMVMRHVLIDRARARATRKRGGARVKLSLDALDLAVTGDFADLLVVDEAIERLGEHDPTLAELVRLRFFAGLTIEETAIAMSESVRSVNRDWSLAKALLAELLQGEGRTRA